MHGEYRGLKTVEHGGSLAGYRAQLLRVPDQRFAVAILANVADVSPGARALEVADVYLDAVFPEARAVEAASSEKVPRENRKSVAIDPDVLDRYVGKYLLRGSILAITREGDRLVAQPGDQPKTPMFAASEFEFFLDIPGVRLQFAAGAGKAKSVVVVQRGRRISCRRVELTERSASDLAAFAGDYRSAELGVTYRIRVEDGKLWVRVGHTERFDLSPTGGDRWTGNGRTFRFQRGDGGSISGYRLDAGRVLNLAFARV